MTRASVAERLWRRVDKTAPGGCWVWTGSADKKGYGRINVDRVPVLVHRLAYTLEVGPIPVGLALCHRCDNPPCCNPDHLFPGTIADNNADMRAKGRQAKVTGPPRRSHCAKGHSMDDAIVRDGGRRCRTCQAEYMRAYGHPARKRA